MHSDIAKTTWRENHQPFELDWHSNDNYRWHDELFILAWISNFDRFANLRYDHFREGDLILDAGCGSRSAFEYFGSGRKCYVDPLIDEYLKIEQVAQYWDGIDRRSMFNHPLEQENAALSGVCALVNCWNVLDHVYDWREALTNLLSYLRPGGILLLCTDTDHVDAGHAGIDDPAWMLEMIYKSCYVTKVVFNHGETVKRDIVLKAIKQ